WEHLNFLDPLEGVPSTGAQQHRNKNHPIALASLKQKRNLFFCTKLGGKIIRRNQTNCDCGLLHRSLDFGIPLLTSVNLTVIPYDNATRLLKRTKLRHKTILPILILVSVAHKIGRFN